MNRFKNILFSALLTIGAFSLVTYTSCSKEEDPIDPCVSVLCQNNGTCLNGLCTCPTGYEGTLCETQSRTKFLKNWNVNETPKISSPYTCLIGAGTNITDVTIANSFADDFFANPIAGTVSGNVVTIPVQKPDLGSNYNVQGTLTYSNGTLTSSYTLTNTITSSTVLITGTWQ